MPKDQSRRCSCQGFDDTARDVGARDIPNNNEGWGRIDLKELLHQLTEGEYGSMIAQFYHQQVTQELFIQRYVSGQSFKAVVAWSDERGSRFSNTPLVNNLNLLVTTPSGVEYKGNEFSQGRSIQGGTHDSLNNVEVVLVDSAEAGLWTVKVTDASQWWKSPTLRGGSIWSGELMI